MEEKSLRSKEKKDMTETSGEMEVPSELETDERADKVTDVDQ